MNWREYGLICHNKKRKMAKLFFLIWLFSYYLRGLTDWTLQLKAEF